MLGGASVTRSVPGSVIELNEGERRSALPAGRVIIHEVHGSRFVAGGDDVGTERTHHEQGGTSRYPDHFPKSEWGGCLNHHVGQERSSYHPRQRLPHKQRWAVVTNYHVIREGVSAIVKLPNGASFHVDGVLASDKNRDVAIIKAHGVDFRTLSLGDSGRLQVGEEVVAIGNPLSLESTVSNGIVSAFRTDENEGGKFVQITAPISPAAAAVHCSIWQGKWSALRLLISKAERT